MTISKRTACWLLVCLSMGMALNGCTPTREQIVADVKGYQLPADVVPGKGLIYIIDTTPMLSFGKSVFLDGDDDAARVGSVSPGRYIYFYVSPGCHTIRLPLWSPLEMVVEVEEGDIVFVQPSMDQRQKNSLVQIDGVMGRYYLKRYRPGESFKYLKQ